MADIRNKLFFYKKVLNYGFGVLELDSYGNIKDANDNFLFLVNRSILNFENRNFLSFLSDTNEFRKNNNALKSAINNRFEFKGKIELRIDKTIFNFYAVVMPEITDASLERILVILTNITNPKNVKEEIDRNKHIDIKTGFFNREKLFSDLANISKKREFTLVLFNLDNLREINLEFGYDVGDIVIKDLAQLLYDKRPTKNTVIYHSYANEFAMLVTVHVTRWDLAEYFKRVSKFLEKQKFKVKNNIIDPKITIGSAQGNKKLFQDADSAVIYAKKHSTPYYLFNPEFSVNSSEEAKMKSIIIYAIDNDLVTPYYQPILNLKSNKIDGYETLIRIEDKDGNIYVADDFLEVARKANLYTRLIYKMFTTALYYYKNKDFKFVINFYKEDLLNPQLADSLLSTIEKYKIGHKIIIEVIKVDKFQNYYNIDKILRGFKAFGCEVAIEDLGHNYSRYEKLGDLNLNYLKISKELIQDIDTRKDKEEVIKEIIAYCKNANVKTIAECIDNVSIFNKVKELGIDFALGCFISLPQRRI